LKTVLAGAAAKQEKMHASESKVVGKNNRRKDCVAFVFYDFKTRQDESLKGTENVKIHVFFASQQICETCAGIDDMCDVTGAKYANLLFGMIR